MSEAVFISRSRQQTSGSLGNWLVVCAVVLKEFPLDPQEVECLGNHPRRLLTGVVSIHFQSEEISVIAVKRYGRISSFFCLDNTKKRDIISLVGVMLSKASSVNGRI